MEKKYLSVFGPGNPGIHFQPRISHLLQSSYILEAIVKSISKYTATSNI